MYVYTPHSLHHPTTFITTQGKAAAHVSLFLTCCYQPHAAADACAQLGSSSGAAGYGALLDLAAYFRAAGLLSLLRAPLATRGEGMGRLVGFEFPAWLEVAERWVGG